jgi:molybdopterin/thiamine biosynthesis adenylyltransferase
VGDNKVKELEEFLREGLDGDLLSWSSQVAASKQFGLSLAQVEETALKAGILPSRYQRNRRTISTECQYSLFRSRVAVLGCGGLGGYIVEQLARLGVGYIVAIDPDVFEEHNLNRQLLSSIAWLGRSKAQAAVERVSEINPAVTVVSRQVAYAPENGIELLQGANVVVDALDSIPTRMALCRTCLELNVPLVHGAIAGWYGQVTTQFPGDETLQKIYGSHAASKGVEKELGNPSFTPAVVASLEVAEVCKILLRRGTSLQRRELMINLLDMNFDEISY